MTGRQQTGDGSAGLRWLIHLTSVAAAGSLLGAAMSQQVGATMTVGAFVGGAALGTLAILRRWLGRRPTNQDGAQRR